MKTALFIFSLVFAYSFNLKAQQIVGAMDGKTFSIEIMKDGKLDSKETIVFDKGMMDPLDCHQYGFAATTYQAKAAAGRTTWAAFSKSEKEGTMSWQGTVNADNIDGTIVWSKDGQERINYTFKGTLAKPAIK